MNIRKQDVLAPDFKSLDWQKAITTMTPKNAVRQLAKEISALVEEMYGNTVTPQHKSRQAELMHNAFVAKAYPQLTGTNQSLFYRDVAIEMYGFRPLHEIEKY